MINMLATWKRSIFLFTIDSYHHFNVGPIQQKSALVVNHHALYRQISFLSDRLRIDHQDKNHLKNKYLHVLIFQKHRVHDQTDDT